MGLRDYEAIVLMGYGVISILNLVIFSRGFLRLGRNPNVLESNGLRIHFQREKIHGNIIVTFFPQKMLFLWACVIKTK